MASLKTISLPHGTIPTQMFGNVNLQNAVMYINENFTEMKSGVNEMISSANDALDAKAEADHDHDESYAALSHTHGMDEIVGLNAKLDDKAALNHEHSQYLSSLPAHYHDVSSIQGLSSALQEKASSVHSHDIGQIANLSTELGAKASTAYVDQQVARLGSSTKTIVESYGSDKGNSEAGKEAEGDVPEPVVAENVPDEETEAERIVRVNRQIGTSDKYARSDHQHVIEMSIGTNPTDNTSVSEEGTNPRQTSLTFTDWSADGTNGVKLRLYGLVESPSGAHILQPVDIEITKDGVVKSVKAPEGNHGIYIRA